MPTPNKTVGLTGCDFNTAVLAASYFNSLTFAAAMVLGVASGGAVADTTAVVFSGWAGGSSTNTLTITPIATQGFRDNPNVLTNALRYNAANGAALFNHYTSGGQYSFGANVIIDGMQISSDIAAANIVTLGAGSVIRNTLITSNTTAASLITAGAGIIVENSIIRTTGGGIGIRLQHAGAVITSCLVIATGTTGSVGIRNDYPTNAPLIKNTAIFNFTTDTQSTAASGSTNNATDKSAFSDASYGTAGQVSITSAEWVSLTSGSEDFRLAAGSTKLKLNGATVGPTVGIRGNARTAPYSIGPDQPTAAASPVTFSGPVPTRNGAVGSAASFANAGFFAGSMTPFSYSLSAGALPAGLTLSSATGIISGTPTTAGTSSGIVVRATDTGSNTVDTNSYSIVIAASNAAPTFPGTIANITGTGGSAITPVNVSGQFSDTDTLTYSASPAGTAWPSGLVVNSSTGIISGTVATSTTNNLKVRATDTAGQTVDSNAFSATISVPVTTGSFVTDAWTSSGTLRASQAFTGTWYSGGAIGTAGGTATLVSGTLGAGAVATLTGLPLGAGFFIGKTADGGVIYQAGTVA